MASLFCAFRALGHITDPVQFAVQQRGRETFVTVAAGNAWQCYNCKRLTLAFVGQQVRMRSAAAFARVRRLLV